MKYKGHQTERSSIYGAVFVHKSSGLKNGRKLYPVWLMPASYSYFVVLRQLSMCVLPNACYRLIDTHLVIKRKFNFEVCLLPIGSESFDHPYPKEKM